MLLDILRSILWLIREKLPAILGFFVTGILVGFLLGRHYSPQPDKIKVAAAYLLLYGTWSTNTQQQDSINLTAYPYTYSWTSGSTAVNKKLFSSEQLVAASISEHKDWDSDLKDLLTAAVAAPAGSLAATLLVGGGTVEKLGKTELIAVSVVTLGGGFIGYEFGHRSQPDTSDEKFIKNMENPELWAGANDNFRQLFRWNIRSCISGVIDKKDRDTFPAVFGSMRKVHHPEITQAACREADRQLEEYKAQTSSHEKEASTVPKSTAPSLKYPTKPPSVR
jgi:hypothetical protein